MAYDEALGVLEKLNGSTNVGNLYDNEEPDEELKQPKMAEATLNKALQGHTKDVRSVAFSPDNKLLASASSDNTVRLWNIPNGDLSAELEGHKSFVYSVAFSPDGKSIVTGSSDKTVRTWSIATKQQVQMLNDHSDEVYSVAWSPNGDVIASGSRDNTVILWDAISVSMKKTLTGHTSFVLSVSFSQNGNKLVSGEWNDSAIIWDVHSGAALTKLAHSFYVLSVCFSPDDQFVVTGGADKIVRMFNVNTGRREKRFEGHTSVVWSVACSFDGSIIASGSGDKSVRLWDVSSTKQLQQLDGHTEMVTSVAFSSDGKFIASGSGNTVHLWNAPSLQGQMEAEQKGIDLDSLRERVCCREIKDLSYLLPCLHPTCSGCVDDMVQEANQKKRKRPSCSNCGETFAQDKLTTVPSGATLLAPTCFDCDEPATHYCDECKNNMCKLHGDGHFNSKRFKDHVVQLVAELPFCHKHSTETALGFCIHCKVLVCGNCSISEHNKLPHLSVTLQEAAKTITDSMKNDAARLLEFAPSINKKIKKHKKILTKLEKDRTQLETEIAQLQAEIAERQAKTADVRSQEKVETLQIEDLESTKALLLTTQNQANTLAATATTLPHSTLVRLQSVVTGRVMQLQTGLTGFLH